MPSDHANIAAAQAAGYIVEQYDQGAGRTPRFITRISKPHVGDATEAGFQSRSEGHSQASQAAADTIALNSLNGFRKGRYGTDGTNVNRGRGGATLVADVS